MNKTNKPKKPEPGEIESMFVDWVLNAIIILQEAEKCEITEKKSVV